MRLEVDVPRLPAALAGTAGVDVGAVLGRPKRLLAPLPTILDATTNQDDVIAESTRTQPASSGNRLRKRVVKPLHPDG
jgi:hypothetical protein